MSCSNPGAAADGNLYSSADVIGGSATFRATAQGGIVFPAGSRAGVFFSSNDGGGNVNSNTTTINTYLSGVLQESDTGTGQLDSTQGGTGAAAYSYFNTTKQFDAVEVDVTTSGGATERIYEICADGHV